MNWELSLFHFIRPQWLGLLPVVVVLWLFARKAMSSGEWASYLPKPMLEALQVNMSKQSTSWQWWLLIAWLVLTIAAAGPTWIQQAVPVVKNQKALVVLLDLSPSMLADDVSPNRLTLAKYKLIDILRKQSDGQVALIVYAGGAHTVSPLTDDPRTIEALLPALTPNLMPSRGSNIEAAIELAQTLFRDAGASSGDIVLLTDGIHEQALDSIRQQMSSRDSLSILAVGSTDNTPIKLQDGGFLRNDKGEIVLARMNPSQLRALAQDLGGRYAELSSNESDVNYVLQNGFDSSSNEEVLGTNNSFDGWLDLAHFLVILILPIVLFCFRKGLIYVLPLMVLVPLESEASVWSDLWKTPDQQGAELIQQEDYEQAAQKFKRKDWSALANYKSGDFEQAVIQLDGRDDVTSLYNKANALAFKGDLEQAVEAYDAALTQQPDHKDALHNKQVVEALLQQQDQQSQDEQSQDEQSQDQQSQDEQSQDQQSQDQQSQDQQSQDQQSQDQQSQDQQSQDQQSQDQQSQDQQSQDQQSQDQQSQDQQSQDQQSQDQQSQDEQSQDQQSQDQPSEDEQATADEKSTAEQQQAEQSDDETNKDGESAQLIDGTPTPLQDSSEQWLRTIQDDPTGLLRRKFQYESRQLQPSGSQSKPRSDEERY